MNWTIYGMECVGALILFTCMIMIPLCKNPVWWIHDYPKDIQEKYFETHERIPTEVLSAPVFLKKGFAVLLALSILTALALAAGATDFKTGFLYAYGLWLLVDWYDCFFLDWVLVCQRQAHPFAGNGAHGQGVSPEEVSCSALGDRHGAWSRSLLAVRPDCGGAGIENEQGFLFVG